MAGESVVGALRVVLGMDTASFEDGAKKAAKSAGAMGDGIKAVFAGTLLSSAVEKVFDKITHAFKEGITHALEFADNMGKMAQKVGISVEELTGLKLSADLADVSMESLSTGLGKLSKEMVAAAGGSKEAKDKFDALGISVKDSGGHLKSATQILSEIADKFHGTEDGAGKVATALGLLGKGGKELIPLLNEGGDSLREFSKVAEQMGLVVSKTTADQAQKFNDNLKILKLAGEGLSNMIVARLLPALVNLSTGYVQTAKDGTVARNAANQITESIVKFVVAAAQAVTTAQFLRDAFKEFGETKDKVAKGEGGLEDLRSAGQRLLDTIIAIDTQTAIYDGKSNFEKPTEKAAELTRKLTDTKNAVMDLLRVPVIVDVGKPQIDTVDQLANKFKEKIQELTLQARQLGGAFTGLAPGFIEAARGLKLFDDSGKGLQETLNLTTKQAQQLNEALFRVNAAKLTQEFQDPWITYQQTMQQLNAQMRSEFPLGAEIYAAASKKAALAVQTSWATTAQSIVSPMAEAFKTLATMNKKYAGIAKAAAIAEALINTYLAATKAFASVPPPFNFAAAAAVTAAGLVNVAKISATEFATGGSFKIGGAGGIDSQLVQFKATPGEMVDVRRPGQDRGGSTEITVRGMAPDDMFTGKWLRGLVDALNVGDSDGYRLRFAER